MNKNRNSQTERCEKCVISASFPNIGFDENGVCDFCRDEKLVVTEQKIIDQSRKRVTELINSEKGKASYDAVMCYSGGKDSTYTLMVAVKKYGLKVLSFTLDNTFIAPEAFANINKVVDALGVDQLTIRPSARFFRSVIKACSLYPVYNSKTLIRISSGCNACISMVNNMALRLALEKKVPFILAGFTLGQIPANAIIYKNNYKFLQESREKSLNTLKEHVGDAVTDYYCIDEELLSQIKSYPYNINLFCLEDKTEDEVVASIKPLGWKRPIDVDGCSSNCRLNTFNNHVHQAAFGYSPYELELSHLIRKGQITRDEALHKINDQPEEQLKDIIEQLGITDEEINNIL